MPDFDVHYADSRMSLVLKADLERGWRRLKKTLGFFRTKWVPWMEDWKIRAHLTFIAQPADFGRLVEKFPPLHKKAVVGANTIDLAATKLIVTVPLGQEKRVFSTGSPGIYIEELGFVTDGLVSFDLRVLVAFHRPGMAKPKDERDWDSEFLQGGLPGTKRSH